MLFSARNITDCTLRHAISNLLQLLSLGHATKIIMSSEGVELNLKNLQGSWLEKASDFRRLFFDQLEGFNCLLDGTFGTGGHIIMIQFESLQEKLSGDEHGEQLYVLLVGPPLGVVIEPKHGDRGEFEEPERIYDALTILCRTVQAD